MEGKSVIKSLFCQIHEICHCDRGAVSVQLYENGAVILYIDLYMVLSGCSLLWLCNRWYGGLDAICKDTQVEDNNGTVAKDNQPVIDSIKVID